MTLRQVFKPSLWSVLVIDIGLLAPEYAMPDDHTGFDWSVLLKTGGYTASIVAIIAVWKSIHSFYFDNRRYGFKLATNGKGWKRSIVVPIGKKDIAIKIEFKRSELLTRCRLSPQMKPIWKVFGHSNELSGALVIDKVTCVIPGYDGAVTDEPDAIPQVALQGRWVQFNPPYDAQRGGNLSFKCSITANRRWAGEIGFLSTSQGRRTAHGKIKVR